MKRQGLIVLLLIAGTIAIGEMKPQTICPVMGGKINKKQYIDTKGVRIYVCCKGCIKVIKADPQTYIDKLKADGVDPEKIPKKADAKK